MRAAAASIAVLRPGGRWRIAVPDAYFSKYLVFLYFVCFHEMIYDIWYILAAITNSIHSEWYQKYSRAGPALVTVQSHMVMWSVDTLPQLFEVPPFFYKLPCND